MSPSAEPGVSFVICTHNGASRIRNVLQCIARQDNDRGTTFEAIVVDNASTDGTGDTVRSFSSLFPPNALRVVREDRLGLIHARKRGVDEARYEYISFIDDDNYVEPLWIRKVTDILDHHPEVGALGSRSDGKYEITPPSWFEKYANSLAIGRQYNSSGDVTDHSGRLWGAGLTIRKTAWQQIIEKGHRFYATGRQGGKLISGEDTELCYAFRIAGWRLWYEDDLAILHFIPANRLTWKYLRQLYFGFGMSSILMVPYLKVLHCETETRSESWIRELVQEFQTLSTTSPCTWGYYLSRREDKYNTLKIIKSFGRIAILLELRERYGQMIKEVREFADRFHV